MRGVDASSDLTGTASQAASAVDDW